MPASIDALELPVQLFAVGTGIGMMSALIRHNRTGEVDHWPIQIATHSLAWFWLGVLISAVEALC